MNRILNLTKNIILNKKFHFFFKIFTFILVLVILYNEVDFFNLFQDINLNSMWLSLLLIFFLFQIFSVSLIIIRWKKLLELANKKEYSFNILISPILYGNLANSITILGSFISRSLLTSANHIKLHSIASTVLLEKILSLLSIIVISFASILFIFYFNFFELKKYISFYSIFLFYFFVLLSFILFYVYRKKIKSFFNTKLILNYFSYYFIARKLIYPLSLSMLIQLLGLFSMICICLFFTTNKPILYFILLLPIIKFISSIPITFTQWGWRELVFIKFFSVIGISENTSFLIGSFYGLSVVLGSLLIVAMYEGFNKFN